METLAELTQNLESETKEKDFSETLAHARDRLGLMQYRVADFVGINVNRFKNLETGYFRAMPSDQELKAISDFYKLDCQELKRKAEKHVQAQEKTQKRIRRIYDFS